MKCNNRTELEARYGVPIGNNWGGERKFMTIYKLPSHLLEVWYNTITGRYLKSIYINIDAKEALEQALSNLFTRGLLSQLKTFDGSFNVRTVRGNNKVWSIHSYGLAIDMNAKWNALGAEPTLTPEFVACWKDAGWCSGGDFRRKDGMHFSYYNELNDRS